MKFNETAYKEKLVAEIRELKKEQDAVILAHNYQRDEIQEIADYIGDSLELSRRAVTVKNKTIVFCGVHFMAECAAILNPDKTVLLPVKEAGCPLADMITVDKLKELKKKHPGVPVVCYVNTSAHIKAESDITATSSNAIKVVNSLKSDKVIFVPDRNLAVYVASHSDKEIILWDGYCISHKILTEEDVKRAKHRHPQAEFLAHPECRIEVLQLANHIASTSGILKYARESKCNEFIIGTEVGVLYKLRQDSPNKKFYSPSQHLLCANMKLTTLGWLARSLKNMQYKVTVKEPVLSKAKKTLERMLEVV
ncbi:MAG: quinolinate synthase NadA [Candidatus Ancaeobacter aquaticus]|nr:quinolinate synthase NadA [Candidatus Ancaeobacter aquaticus]